VSAHAGPVIDHAGNRLQSVIDHLRQQVANANVRRRHGRARADSSVAA
jgi:hypothetical protein